MNRGACWDCMLLARVGSHGSSRSGMMRLHGWPSGGRARGTSRLVMAQPSRPLAAKSAPRPPVALDHSKTVKMEDDTQPWDHMSMPSLSAETLPMAPHVDVRPEPNAQQHMMLAAASRATGMSPEQLMALIMTQVPGLQLAQSPSINRGETLMSVGSSDSLVEAVLLAQTQEDSVLGASASPTEAAVPTLASLGETAAPAVVEVPLPHLITRKQRTTHTFAAKVRGRKHACL